MRIDYLGEPDLEFGLSGRHPDIRFGLALYGPFDLDEETRPKAIRVGLVGTDESVDGLGAWLERCSHGVAAKVTKQPNLFPCFPGFRAEAGFRCSVVLDSQLQRRFSKREILQLPRGRVVEDAAEFFVREIRALDETRSVDVFMCALPLELLDAMADCGKPPIPDQRSQEDEEEVAESEIKTDFHDLLKAKVMVAVRKPIQIVLPSTYDEAKRRKQKKSGQETERLQDEATRAWNLFTALYYKAGGLPWRIPRDSSELATCYVGVSFYVSLDKSQMRSSIAQIFNERGEGLILRGGHAQLSDKDKQPHLSEGDAFSLLHTSLEKYRSEHRTLPARVVMHKTSRYSPDELTGFRRALVEKDVYTHDFLTVGPSLARLFRRGAYPPLRGTYVHLDDSQQLLYTRGSIHFYGTYPGMYVPKSLNLLCEDIGKERRYLAQEILSLSKMNWNNTQFDGLLPITIRAARRVGRILKYVAPGNEMNRYSFYM